LTTLLVLREQQERGEDLIALLLWYWRGHLAGGVATVLLRAWLTDQLTECAKAAVRTKETYLAAHYAQLRGRRGEAKAIGAIRHDLLVAYYHIDRDLGPDWQRKRYSVEHRARRLQRQLEALGYAVTLDQLDQPAEQAA
jgi:hypothetical protein